MSVPQKWVAAKKAEQQTTRRIAPGKGERIPMGRVNSIDL
jgi:hypothetical protein